MKVLMLGWEFPPYISGGLGTACLGLTYEMSKLGTEILFVLPHGFKSQSSSHVKFLAMPEGAEKIKGIEFRPVDVHLYPYVSSGKAVPVEMQTGGKSVGQIQELHEVQHQTSLLAGAPKGEIYGRNIGYEVHHYSHLVAQIAAKEQFDVIHAHDWMTYPAAVWAAQVSGKPLVIHVHSTEFDRSGENINKWIYDIERRGMYHADNIITVSNYTRRICLDRYAADDRKIKVVYNGILDSEQNFAPVFKTDEKVVLFLGRITMQKGPEYFVAAAKKVLEKVDNVKFVVAGSGDMMHRTIEQVAREGLGHKILFSGFLRGRDVDRAFSMADLFVMPSVSEPFGIAPLEALSHGVPVIISKQSGVSEVLSHALKVDFWDINEMANKIVAVLKYPALHQTLKENGATEAKRLCWKKPARECLEIYRQLTRMAS